MPMSEERVMMCLLSLDVSQSDIPISEVAFSL